MASCFILSEIRCLFAGATQSRFCTAEHRILIRERVASTSACNSSGLVLLKVIVPLNFGHLSRILRLSQISKTANSSIDCPKTLTTSTRACHVFVNSQQVIFNFVDLKQMIRTFKESHRHFSSTVCSHSLEHC